MPRYAYGISWQMNDIFRSKKHLINSNPYTLEFVFNPTDDEICHWCAKYGFDSDFHAILEEYHHEEVVGRDYAKEGDEHKWQCVK